MNQLQTVYPDNRIVHSPAASAPATAPGARSRQGKTKQTSQQERCEAPRNARNSEYTLNWHVGKAQQGENSQTHVRRVRQRSGLAQRLQSRFEGWKITDKIFNERPIQQRINDRQLGWPGHLVWSVCHHGIVRKGISTAQAAAVRGEEQRQ